MKKYFYLICLVPVFASNTSDQFSVCDSDMGNNYSQLTEELHALDDLSVEFSSETDPSTFAVYYEDTSKNHITNVIKEVKNKMGKDDVTVHDVTVYIYNLPIARKQAILANIQAEKPAVPQELRTNYIQDQLAMLDILLAPDEESTSDSEYAVYYEKSSKNYLPNVVVEYQTKTGRDIVTADEVFGYIMGLPAGRRKAILKDIDSNFPGVLSDDAHEKAYIKKYLK